MLKSTRLYPGNAIQAKAMSMESRVTGMPTRACSQKPIFMPNPLACSTVIRFAMLPTMNRFPA